MPLPAAVTIASAALVVASGIGYAVSAQGASPAQHQAAPPVHTHHQAPKHQAPPAVQHTKPAPKPHKQAVPSTLVVVFNNTDVQGLAARKATFLRNAGWHVAAIDNWYGDIPASTVYYPPHMEAQARQLAHVLHITRLHPAVVPMQFDRLTVILATG